MYYVIKYYFNIGSVIFIYNINIDFVLDLISLGHWDYLIFGGHGLF